MSGQEGWRAAIQARLELAAATQDLTSLLEPGALAESRQLAGMLDDGDGDLQSRYLLGWFHWYRYQALPEGQDKPDLDAALEMFTQCFIAGASGLPSAVDAMVARRAVTAATTLLDEALGSPDPGLATEAVGLWKRVVEATPAGHPGQADRLSSLGAALLILYWRTGVPADLDASIEAQQAAVDATPRDDPDWADCLSKLGIALHTRFTRTEVMADLDKAIEAAVDGLIG